MAGLQPWFSALSDPGNARVVCMGDSTTWGTGTTGGLGWPDALRTKLATRFRERASDGLHDSFRNFTFTTSADAWTKATTSDSWDRSLALSGSSPPAQATYLGNGATKIATWTKPSTLTVKELTFWVVDGSGASDFSYDVTGLGFWGNIPTQTWNNDNSIKQIKIQPGNISSIRVRCSNAAGTATNVYLLGIEPTNGTRSSPVIHNLGAPSQMSTAFNRITSGNWHAFLDVVQPHLVTYMMTNDSAFTQNFGGQPSNVATTWQSTVEAIVSQVTGAGAAMVLIAFFEQDPASRGSAYQQAYRDMLRTIAGNYGVPYIDLYDLMGGGYSYASGLGYIADGLHPTDTGAAWIADQVWKVIGRAPTNIALGHS